MPMCVACLYNKQQYNTVSPKYVTVPKKLDAGFEQVYWS